MSRKYGHTTLCRSTGSLDSLILSDPTQDLSRLMSPESRVRTYMHHHTHRLGYKQDASIDRLVGERMVGRA